MTTLVGVVRKKTVRKITVKSVASAAVQQQQQHHIQHCSYNTGPGDDSTYSEHEQKVKKKKISKKYGNSKVHQFIQAKIFLHMRDPLLFYTELVRNEI